MDISCLDELLKCYDLFDFFRNQNTS